MKTNWPELPMVSDPVKNCNTCAHQVPNDWCVLAGFSCEIIRQTPGPPCDENLSGWQQRPPRRSLLQWLYDTFLRIEFK